MSIDLGNYNDVASRMREFFEKYPDGRLCEHAPWRVETIGDRAFVVYQAAAYRTADDPRPGVGTAWEPFPGRTPYTKDSELQNAETSAWGRAILAIGAADTKKGVASQEEVRNRQADRDEWEQAAKPPNPEQVAIFNVLAEATRAMTRESFATVAGNVKRAHSRGEITQAQFEALDGIAGARIRELTTPQAEQGDGGTPDER